MKPSHATPLADIRNALGILNRNIPETDDEIQNFLDRFDAGEIDAPEIPPHLAPESIVMAIQERQNSRTGANGVVPFPTSSQADQGLDRLRIAARNGGESLSEETIRKMQQAENSDKQP